MVLVCVHYVNIEKVLFINLISFFFHKHTFLCDKQTRKVKFSPNWLFFQYNIQSKSIIHSMPLRHFYINPSPLCVPWIPTPNCLVDITIQKAYCHLSQFFFPLQICFSFAFFIEAKSNSTFGMLRSVILAFLTLHFLPHYLSKQSGNPVGGTKSSNIYWEANDLPSLLLPNQSIVSWSSLRSSHVISTLCPVNVYTNTFKT